MSSDATVTAERAVVDASASQVASIQPSSPEMMAATSTAMATTTAVRTSGGACTSSGTARMERKAPKTPTATIEKLITRVRTDMRVRPTPMTAYSAPALRPTTRATMKFTGAPPAA